MAYRWEEKYEPENPLKRARKKPMFRPITGYELKMCTINGEIIVFNPPMTGNTRQEIIDALVSQYGDVARRSRIADYIVEIDS